MTAASEKAAGEWVKTEIAMPADGMNAAAERGLGTSRWQLTDNLHQFSGYAEGESPQFLRRKSSQLARTRSAGERRFGPKAEMRTPSRHVVSVELQPDRFDDRRPPGNIFFDEAPEFLGC
jgi:hypothetical protein